MDVKGRVSTIGYFDGAIAGLCVAVTVTPANVSYERRQYDTRPNHEV